MFYLEEDEEWHQKTFRLEEEEDQDQDQDQDQDDEE